jgi:NitT/TauT family transport system substrate-binding protein
MEKYGLVEKQARAAGHDGLHVRWVDLGGPSVVNDALLTGAADVVSAGPPAFITIWARTVGSLGVKGMAAMTSIPMYLNTRSPKLNSVRELGDQDRIAVTAIKVSIPAIVMQMYAKKEYGASDYTHFDRYTVSLTHPDGVIALLSGKSEITGHFTSPLFSQRERKDPRIRTIMTSDEVMGGPSTFTMLYAASKFRDSNPKVYGAVLNALAEAIAMIAADKRDAAQIFLGSADGKGWTVDEIVEVLNDPDVKFTTVPENVMTYADFMSDVGSVKARPASWKDMFFPEIHGVSGS